MRGKEVNKIATTRVVGFRGKFMIETKVWAVTCHYIAV
jgi:hypothetical protein